MHIPELGRHQSRHGFASTKPILPWHSQRASRHGSPAAGSAINSSAGRDSPCPFPERHPRPLAQQEQTPGWAKAGGTPQQKENALEEDGPRGTKIQIVMKTGLTSSSLCYRKMSSRQTENSNSETLFSIRVY